MNEPIQMDIRDILDLLSNENWNAADSLIESLKAGIKSNRKIVLEHQSDGDNPMHQTVFETSEKLEAWYNNLKKDPNDQKQSDS